jgi:hypothetical protein
VEGAFGTGSKQSSHVGVVIAVKRRAHVQLLGGDGFQIKLGGLLDTGSGLALFGVRVAIVPEDRRVQVAHAGPGTGAIVDHEVEEVDRLLELVRIVEISIPRGQVGGERIARAGEGRTQTPHQGHEEGAVGGIRGEFPVDVEAVVVVLGDEGPEVGENGIEKNLRTGFGDHSVSESRRLLALPRLLPRLTHEG